MPLARTATPITVAEPTKTEKEPRSIMGEEGRPLSQRFYDYFNTDWETVEFDDKSQRELNYIWNHALENVKEKNQSNIITYIDRLSRKLGSPRLDERRYTKLYNWLVVQNNIKSLKKEQSIYERKKR